MRHHLRLSTLLPCASLLLLASPVAQAACNLLPGPGDTHQTCDSGTSGPFTDTLGNNSLTFPTNGSGVINGNVTFGAGADRVLMDSGTITGSLDQSDGSDSLEINAGQITGAVYQGNGIDEFKMTGGQIQSLAQGDGRDRFLMTAGTIVGAFEDGDMATMAGGTIGRVDMKLDNNIFEMSGGGFSATWSPRSAWIPLPCQKARSAATSAPVAAMTSSAFPAE